MSKYKAFIFVQILLLQNVQLQNPIGASCTFQHNGERGICQAVNNCRSVRYLYDYYGIRPTWCSTFGTPVVCCSDNFQQGPTLNAPVRKRISETKCEEYSKAVVKTLEVLPLLVDSDTVSTTIENCDYSTNQLIVGGESAKIGEFPHMALIGWESTDGGYLWLCGGSLISERFVLTAGHCIYTRNQNLANGEPTVVRLGEYDITTRVDGVNAQNYKIDAIIKHPGFTPPSKYNDIALMRLQGTVSLNKGIRPACLWTEPTFNNRKVIATGWGLTKNRGSPSDTLQRVTLDVIDTNTCKQFYTPTRQTPNSIIDSQLCAGDLKGGKDTCQGDSGGPIQIYSESNKCIFYLVGITSVGKACGSLNSAGVYTKVSSYVDWIEGIVWNNGR